jgi:DNA-directed RNA polymerase
MTPDSKKKTTTKIPAKKTVATKTAVSSKRVPAKGGAKKKVTSTKDTPVKTVAKQTVVSTKKAPAKKVTKKSTLTAKPKSQSISISSEERWKMIAIAAYHKAERRGFAPGHELQDWAEAEQEIDELLMSG